MCQSLPLACLNQNKRPSHPSRRANEATQLPRYLFLLSSSCLGRVTRANSPLPRRAGCPRGCCPRHACTPALAHIPFKDDLGNTENNNFLLRLPKMPVSMRCAETGGSWEEVWGFVVIESCFFFVTMYFFAQQPGPNMRGRGGRNQMGRE